MSRIKFLTIAVVALLIANIAFVVFFFAGRRGHHRHAQPREVIMERLHFSKEQEAQYEGLIQNHRSSIAQLEGDIMHLRNELYSHLNDPAIWPQRDSIQSQLAKLQAQIEAVHYDHFMAIKGICTSEQLPMFQELSTEIAQIFSKSPSKEK
jgi:periplasmic protein CpxP/Spy